MGFRLAILSWWTPNYIIRRELDHVSDLTTDTLENLLETSASVNPAKIAEAKVQLSINVEEKRSQMAKEHAKLVEALVVAIGRDEALKQGRAALFEVGRNLGEETRDRLKIGDNPKDLIKAAKILYRVLGIAFGVEWLGETRANLIVDRCALAKEYSELTCLVLSAADEGVIKGLNPRASMMFRERITSGCRTCKAIIEFSREEAVR